MPLFVHKQYPPSSASSEMSLQHLAGGEYIQIAISSESALSVVWNTMGASHQDITADPDETVQVLLKAALTDCT